MHENQQNYKHLCLRMFEAPQWSMWNTLQVRAGNTVSEHGLDAL